MNKIGLGASWMAALLLSASVAHAQLSADDALSQFVSAGLAYKEARYDEAIERYKSVLKGGLENGPLYYNLANAYFKKNNLGQSILNYERARRLMPRDSDVKFNSEYAAAQVKQYVDEKKLGMVQQAMRKHAEFYSYNEMTLIIFGLIFMIGIAYIVFMIKSQPPNVQFGTYALLSLLIFIFIAGIFVKHSYEHNLAVVLTESDTLFEPRTDSTVHFKLSEGMRARIIQKQGRWLKIERLDGKQGWVDNEVLQEI